MDTEEYRKKIEEEILAIMTNEDEFLKREKNLMKEYEELKSKIEGEIAEEEKRVEILKKEIEEKLKEREEKKKNIEDKFYEIYERIRDLKKDKIAICKIEDEKCGGCYIFLPTYIIEKVKQQKEIIQCENCSRILYE